MLIYEKIRCSEGVFSLIEFLDYLDMSYDHFKRYMKLQNEKGNSEKDIIEGLILCKKIKKRLNLNITPHIENVVKFHGEYYPSVKCVSKMNGWDSSRVFGLMKNGISLEEMGEYIHRRKSTMAEKTYNLLKSGEDENSRVIRKGDYITIQVNGKEYETIGDLARDYGVEQGNFVKRLEKGYSISKALSITKDRKVPIIFLGKNFSSISDLSAYYGISRDSVRAWVKSYGLSEFEKLIDWLNCVVEESGVSLPKNVKWGYLLRISKGLRYNKEDIIYQIKNFSKLEKGCNFYLGGRSYKYMTNFYTGTGLCSKNFLYNKIIVENPPIYRIADMLNGIFDINIITCLSYSSYLYLYFEDLVKNMRSKQMMEFQIESIRDQIMRGYSPEEIVLSRKDCMLLLKSVFTDPWRFVRTYLGCVASMERLVEYFNLGNGGYKNSTQNIEKFLQCSDIKVLRQAHRVDNVQYFLCKKDNKLEYLSGTELLNISLESVKGKKNDRVQE